MEIKNKRGDIILNLDVGSWEYTYWCMLVDSDSMGFPVMSEDKCAQLLVWVLEYGGACESVTQNRKMYLDITFAQMKFNIYGAESPSVELIQHYYNELKATKSYPDWVTWVAKKYDITMPKL